VVILSYLRPARGLPLIAGLLSLAAVETGRAQDAPTLDPDQVLNYRGIYSRGDDGIVYGSTSLGAQSTNLLSIPISFWLRRLPCCGNPPSPEVDDHTFGVRLRLTGVIGYAEFDSIAEFDIGSVDLGAIFPGIEFMFKTGDRSMLRPYLDIGYATTSSDSTSIVYGELGLRTEFVWPLKRWELGLEPRLKGGYGFTDIEDADLGHVTISAKADARYPLGFAMGGYTPDIGVYFEPSWSPFPVTYQTTGGEERSLSTQYELGVTMGFRFLAPMLCSLFRMPRLGIGWRFGDGTSGVHIRIGGDRVTRLPLP
jgi:hypothetical protein